MSWGGIQNLPPGFDALEGRRGPANIIDEVIKGRIPGLPSSREVMFVDLRRHLLHRDYARYFESCLSCAAVLADLENGKYLPEVLGDIVEPALTVAIEQMRSVEKDATLSKSRQRKLEYDARSSLDQLYRKSLTIAVAYPQAEGSRKLEQAYAEISRTVAELSAGQSPQ